MSDINHVEAVLQAKINEVEAMNRLHHPALEHHIQVLEALNEWLKVSPLKGTRHGSSNR